MSSKRSAEPAASPERASKRHKTDDAGVKTVPAVKDGDLKTLAPKEAPSDGPSTNQTSSATGKEDFKVAGGISDADAPAKRDAKSAAEAGKNGDTMEKLEPGAKEETMGGRYSGLWDMVPAGWRRALEGENQKPYWNRLVSELNREAATGAMVYPQPHHIFRALELCPDPGAVRVVILGQDPYVGEKQAEGLCFSVADGVAIPPSLKNIFEELATDIEHYQTPSSGSLVKWAEQGVLMLNTSLTVRHALPMAHAAYGWHHFTRSVMRAIAEVHRETGVIVLAWGQPAQKSALLFEDFRPGSAGDEGQDHAIARGHVILTAAHPSPRSADKGFFGCGHFSQTNRILADRGQTPIVWQT